LKKHFSSKKDGEKIGLLTTSAFNLAMKKALVKTKEPEGYMLSAHNIRKTHGNWLKIMGNLRLMEVDPTEICLRLGHDYNTFLRDYGSSGVMDNKDVMVIQEILGDLYRRWKDQALRIIISLEEHQNGSFLFPNILFQIY